MTTTFQIRRPRRVFLAAVSAAVLAACGGGGGSEPTRTPNGGGTPGQGPVGGGPGQQPGQGPTILRFEASSASAFVGEPVRLSFDFQGGQGRVDPTLGAVVSGTDVLTHALDRDMTFRLVVGAPGAQDVERELTVRAVFRDAYASLATTWRGAGHAAVATADGALLLIGGVDGDGAPSTRIDRFDPRTGSALPLGTLRTARLAPVAVRLTAGQVLVTGAGMDPADAATAELVDERTGQTTPAGTMSVVRSEHAAIELGGGRVLVTGGLTLGEGTELAPSSSAEIWEPATRSFRRLSQALHTARAGHTMTALGDGRILLVGGVSLSAQPLLAEIFDPVTERFTPVYTAWPMRHGHAALHTPDGGVLVIGGTLPAPGGNDGVATASVLRYDRVTQTFAELSPLAAARARVQAAMLPGGQVLVFGGEGAGGSAMASAERYDVQAGGTPIRTLPGARTGHTVTRLPSGRVAVAGGEDVPTGQTTGVLVYH